MESREEEGQGQPGPARGDVGRARGLRLVAEVVGAVAVGLRLEQATVTVSKHNKGENKARKPCRCDTQCLLRLKRNDPGEIPVILFKRQKAEYRIVRLDCDVLASRTCIRMAGPFPVGLRDPLPCLWTGRSHNHLQIRSLTLCWSSLSQ